MLTAIQSPHNAIAKDLDEGAIRIAVRQFQDEGREITVAAIAKTTRIAASRVEPVLRRLADEWVRAGHPSQFS